MVVVGVIVVEAAGSFEGAGAWARPRVEAAAVAARRVAVRPGASSGASPRARASSCCSFSIVACSTCTWRYNSATADSSGVGGGGGGAAPCPAPRVGRVSAPAGAGDAPATPGDPMRGAKAGASAAKTSRRCRAAAQAGIKPREQKSGLFSTKKECNLAKEHHKAPEKQQFWDGRGAHGAGYMGIAAAMRKNSWYIQFHKSQGLF